MKILVISQYYYPEPFRITDICEELVCRGHSVTVITGVPNYPMGKIYSGYEHGKRAQEIINGVHVIRCQIHPRKKGALHRLWNYYSYPFRSKHAVSRLEDDFDVVFIYQLSPVMMANAGIRYAKKHRIKSILYCLDLWPASLSAGGVNGGLMYKWFAKESSRIYRAADQILLSSDSFSTYFKKEFGIDDTIYLPQYAESTFLPSECGKKPDGCIDLMFAGNVGTAQSVDTVVKAAALCKDMPELRWHIVGDGIALPECKKLAEALDAPVIFHGRQAVSEMPRYYAMADAMLVTMKKDPIISLTLPGKVQSYMAAGKPIIGAIDGEAKIVIEQLQCGYCVSAEDYESLAAVCKKFAGEKSMYAAWGSRARSAYEKLYSKNRYISALENYFGCANKAQAPEAPKRLRQETLG